MSGTSLSTLIVYSHIAYVGKTRSLDLGLGLDLDAPSALDLDSELTDTLEAHSTMSGDLRI